MTIDINEGKRKIQNMLEKCAFMEHKIEDCVTEANMHKERVESMREENRKVVNEAGVLQKSIDN